MATAEACNVCATVCKSRQWCGCPEICAVEVSRESKTDYEPRPVADPQPIAASRWNSERAPRRARVLTRGREFVNFMLFELKPSRVGTRCATASM
jgi:hypothetical protein